MDLITEGSEQQQKPEAVQARSGASSSAFSPPAVGQLDTSFAGPSTNSNTLGIDQGSLLAQHLYEQRQMQLLRQQQQFVQQQFRPSMGLETEAQMRALEYAKALLQFSPNMNANAQQSAELQRRLQALAQQQQLQSLLSTPSYSQDQGFATPSFQTSQHQKPAPTTKQEQQEQPQEQPHDQPQEQPQEQQQEKPQLSQVPQQTLKHSQQQQREPHLQHLSSLTQQPRRDHEQGTSKGEQQQFTASEAWISDMHAGSRLQHKTQERQQQLRQDQADHSGQTAGSQHVTLLQPAGAIQQLPDLRQFASLPHGMWNPQQHSQLLGALPFGSFMPKVEVPGDDRFPVELGDNPTETERLLSTRLQLALTEIRELKLRLMKLSSMSAAERRNKDACIEHKRKHQRCPEHCSNRRRSSTVD